MNTKDIWHWLGPMSRGWGAEEKLRDQSAVLRWSATGISHMARAMYVEHGVLHLSAGSHVVAAELNLLKGKLLARLDEVAPECGVVDLRFHVQAWERPLPEVAVVPPTKEEIRRARRELPAGLPPRVGDVTATALAWAKARDQAILAAGGWRCEGCAVVVTKEGSACPVCGIERPRGRR